MFRYRVIRGPSGRYMVLPALTSVVPLEETYAARRTAQETADWLNHLDTQELAAISSASVSSLGGAFS